MPRSRQRESAYQRNEIMKELNNLHHTAVPAAGVRDGNPNRSASEILSATRITRRRFLERTALGVAATGLGVSALEAQDWARQAVDKSPRRHETVKVTYNDRSVDTFIAYPQAEGKSPAVIIIHDVIAFAPWVENAADKFAEAGYLALAPDLLSGRTPEERQPLQSATGTVGPARRLPLPQVAADMNALADYAKKLPACNGKVCVVGFSWGGDQAFRFATTRKDLLGGIRVLRHLPGTGEHPQHRGARVWFLRGNRHARRRHPCGDDELVSAFCCGFPLACGLVFGIDEIAANFHAW